MGAPLLYAPLDGHVHKRGAMMEEGYFYGIQWPVVMVKLKSDGKILSVSRKKICVYEKQYTCPLDQKATYDGDVELEMQEVKQG